MPRQSTVHMAVQSWKARLIDTSRRNPLASFRDTKTTALWIEHRDLWQRLVDGFPLGLKDFEGRLQFQGQTRSADEVQALFRNLQKRALTDREEKGIETLALAIGFATWNVEDGSRNPRAPVLLLPAEIRGKGFRLEVAAAGDLIINPVLVQMLKRDLGISPFNYDGNRGGVPDHDEVDLHVDTVFDLLTNACAEIAGFGLEGEAGLGTFRYQRMAMVADLEKNEDEVAGHGIVQALAGHAGARTSVVPEGGGALLDLDEIPPAEEFLVLEADASQRHAIHRILRGESGVVHGPPGTGKSQTIANLLAECAAAGKKVLFVAEKKAAIDAVIRRLEETGLGHIALNLHSAGLKKKAVAERLNSTLNWIRESRPVTATDVHQSYERAREQLAHNVRRVHAIRPETGESLFTMWGALLRMPEAAKSEFTISKEVLPNIDSDRVVEIEQMLGDAARAPEIFLRHSSHPWALSLLDSGADVEEVLEQAASLRKIWPSFSDALRVITTESGISLPDSVEQCLGLLECTIDACSVGSAYERLPSHEELEKAVSVFAPAIQGRGSFLWAWLASAEFRRARGTIISARASKTDFLTLSGEVATLFELSTRLRELGVTALPTSWTPSMPQSQARDVASTLLSLLTKLGRNDPSLRLDATIDLLDRIRESHQAGAMVPGIRAIQAGLAELDLQDFVDHLLLDPCPPELWPERFRFVWLNSHLYRIEIREPGLAAFRGRTHDETVRAFRKWDVRRTRLARDRVRHSVAARAVSAMESEAEQAAIVRREANKKSRHIPIRRLFEEAGDVLTRIVPCWVASPLSVSELLDARANRFDLVIFDEGSQVPTEDAVPAVYRSRQVVVAGDPQQLPPTTFFNAEADDSDGDEALDEELEGFESVLDVVLSFLPSFHLQWHYRSEDERLIAFSNYHIYDSGLITLPSAHAEERIGAVVVGRKKHAGGQSASSSHEVLKVVQLALEHARVRPSESLGIIAFGNTHRRRVEAALDKELANQPPDVREFFSHERHDRVFVKNLETVQGDERDAIILTVGYGWNANGDLPHRFGPLTQDVGYRRLNVAVTRSRKRMTLVSSFEAGDVDLSRSGSRGVRLLREFLDYAAYGGSRVREDPLASPVPLNPFELDIKLALERRGMNLVGQYGASRYRIDLVAMHPEQLDQPVLAIECDGASYHSSQAARDRDRLRQEQLQSRGWRFHRIWSTDWFYRREEEITRAVAAYEEALGLFHQSRMNFSDPDLGSKATLAHSEEWEPEVIKRSGPPRPELHKFQSIEDIPIVSLVNLGLAILADGRQRTLEELVEEMFQATPFTRRGTRIIATLTKAAKRARKSVS